MKNFKENLNELMKENNLKNTELAAMLSVSSAMVGNYRKGTNEPKLSKLQEIAKAFNISIEQLVNGNENTKNDIEEQLMETFRELNYENKVEAVSSTTALLVKQRLLMNKDK